jgi:L-malate glycosyltransferase
MSHTVRTPAPILFVVHALGHGGMERQLSGLVCGLDRTRFEPHVACAVEGFRADEIRQHGIPIVRIPIVNFWNPGPLALARFLADYIRRHRIRIVHLFDAGLGLVTALAARRVPGTLLLTSQRFYMGNVPRDHRYFLLFAHWMANGVVANCLATREHLHAIYRYPLSRIEVCYNGLNEELFWTGPRTRLDELRGATVVIGCVCVFRAEKNLPQLLEVFARVRERVPGVKLLLMGSGPEEAKIHATAMALGIEGDCCFLPSAADVSAALRSIDVFVHPSLTEGLPNAVMEAMASGCSVVATRVGGCSELIEHEVDGLLAEPRNLEELERCVMSLITDGQKRERLSIAAIRKIREAFSFERALAAMEQIYTRTLSGAE